MGSIGKEVTSPHDPAEFEGQNWKQARENFRKKHEDSERLRSFLQSRTDGDTVKDTCLKLKDQSENKYHQGLGGILDNIDALMNLGDIAIKSAPESVGLAWMGVRMCLHAVQGDWAAFQLFSGACADIIGIMISCRVYGKLYGGQDGPSDFQELHAKVVDYIPQIYTDILEFSYAVYKYTQKNVVIRIGKNIFRDVKTGFEGQIEGIKACDEKMRDFAKTASERMIIHLQTENIKNQDTMRLEIVSLKETLDVSLKANENIVRRFFEELEKERKDTRQKTPYEKAQDEYEENMASLNPSEVQYELLQKNLDVYREPQTCRWTFDFTEYNEWHDSPQSSILWVSGAGGCGKSILMSTVIERLRAQHSDNSKAVVQYFFCKAGSGLTQNTTQILTTVVAHLYAHSLAFPDVLEQANMAVNKSSIKANKSGGMKFNFETAYNGLLQAMDRDVFLVIDALDECVDRQDQELLRQLRMVVNNAGSRAKIMVGSRPETDIGIDLRGVPNVKCEDHNSPDITRNVTTEMRTFPGWTSFEKRYAVQRIVQKSGGQFKFVQIALDFLRKPLIRPFEPIVDQLPNGLTGSYITSWNAINPDYLELLKTALTWTLFADGSVTVAEIMDAYSRTYSVEAGVKEEQVDDETEELHLEPEKLDLRERQVKIAGGPFLEVLNSGHVNLRHLTVRDFFVAEDQNSILTSRQDTKSESDPKRMPSFRHTAANVPPWTVSAKKGHLEILKVIAQNLTSSVFQKRYLLPYRPKYDFETLEDPGFSKERTDFDRGTDRLRAGLWGPQAGDVVGSLYEDSEMHEQGSVQDDDEADGEADDDYDEDGEETSDKAVDKSTGSAGSQSQSQTANSIQGSDRGHDSEHEEDEDVDYESSSTEATEVTMSADNETDQLPRSSLRDKRVYRYELLYWHHHLREAQKLWSAEEQDSDADWKCVWEDLLKFLCEDSPGFRAWRRIYSYNSPDGLSWVFQHGSPLHVAAFFGLSSLVRKLIDRGDTAAQRRQDQTLRKYRSPLDCAVEPEDMDVATVKFLVDHDADLNVLNGYYTPFHDAIRHNPTYDFIKYLLAHGADPSITSDRGRTALHYFCADGTDPGVLGLLLNAGKNADLINFPNKSGETPLHELVQRSDLPLALLRACLDSGADVNIEDENSMRPLHSLASNGNTSAVELLIEQKADIHDDDDEGRTALHGAAKSGNASTVKILLDNGAKSNLRDNRGRTPLFLACEADNEETAIHLIQFLSSNPAKKVNKADYNGSTPLREAAARGNVTLINSLLSTTDQVAAAINAYDARSLRTSAHKAAQNGRKLALEVLIEHGADMALKDKDELTPFQLCVKSWMKKRYESRAMEETLLLLLSKGDHPASELNDLVFKAAIKGSVKIVQCLVEAGLSLNEEDAHGWTPLMLAQHENQQGVVDLILRQRKPGGRMPSSWMLESQILEISPDGLEARGMDLQSVSATVTSDHPIPATQTRYYFEVEITLNDEEDSESDDDDGSDENDHDNDTGDKDDDDKGGNDEEEVDEDEDEDEDEDGDEDDSGPAFSDEAPDIVIGATTLPIRADDSWLGRYLYKEMKEYGPKTSYGWRMRTNELNRCSHNRRMDHSDPDWESYEVGDIVGCAIDYTQKLIMFTKNGQLLGTAFTKISGRLYPAVSLSGRYVARANFGGDLRKTPFRWEGWKAWCKGL